MYLVAAHRLYCIYRKAWEQLDSALVYIGEGYGSPPASSPLLRPLYSALPAQQAHFLDGDAFQGRSFKAGDVAASCRRCRLAFAAKVGRRSVAARVIRHAIQQ